jgi:glycosyltransferase involved in cell wall biosynthesis
MVRMATHIVTHSVTVREEIVQEFNLPKERVSVIPLAPGAQFFPASDPDQSVLETYDVHQPYVLFVGTLEPRKNLVTLVRAFASLPPAVLSATQLVLCGRWGWMNDDLKAEIARFRPAQSLRITGYVPDSHLPALYRSATVFVYPSLYEGFGLPPVEAMASRVPVVASTAAALTEVLGDAALRVDPLDVEGWSQSLQNLLGDAHFRETHARRGLLHVQKFSWNAAADNAYKIY